MNVALPTRRRITLRIAAAVAAFAVAIGLAVAGPAAVARADGVNGLPDCMHDVLGYTQITVPLTQASPSAYGGRWAVYLSKWTSSGWQYTGDVAVATVVGGGLWSQNGRITHSLGFSLYPGSGYYRLWLRVFPNTGGYRDAGTLTAYYSTQYPHPSTLTPWCQA